LNFVKIGSVTVPLSSSEFRENWLWQCQWAVVNFVKIGSVRVPMSSSEFSENWLSESANEQ